MTRGEAVNWIINISADIGKVQHQELWHYEQALSEIREMLEYEEPEEKWIPCSERLPEDGTECLVSVKCSKKVVVVDMATYSTDLFKVDKDDFFGNRGESGWYYLSREYGYCKMLNVIAWMPVPESYKEEQ